MHGKYYEEIKDWDCNLEVQDLTECPNLKEMATEFVKKEIVEHTIKNIMEEGR
jgi:hypothetical protein